MFLSDRDLWTAIEQGDLAIAPLEEAQIGPTSIDLHLGSSLLKYTSPVIKLGRSTPQVETIELDPAQGYVLEPGGYVLGSTMERVYIGPMLQGWLDTKGDIARAGLSVHNCDGHIDPGFSGTITLEISNRNTIPVVLYPNILICQLFAARLTSPCAKPYAGKYYGQMMPSSYVVRRPERLDLLGAELLREIGERQHESDCLVFIDLDETIFGTVFRWVEQIGTHFEMELPIEDVKKAGNLDNYFQDRPEYPRFLQLVDNMRQDPRMYENITLIDGVTRAIKRLQETPRLSLAAYLTARPEAVKDVTGREMAAVGLPHLPLIMKPAHVTHRFRSQWKLETLKQIQRAYAGHVVVIDDDPELALLLKEYNAYSDRPIVSILFRGPLTTAYVDKTGTTSSEKDHYYVADWEDIPGICRAYAG